MYVTPWAALAVETRNATKARTHAFVNARVRMRMAKDFNIAKDYSSSGRRRVMHWIGSEIWGDTIVAAPYDGECRVCRPDGGNRRYK